MILLQSVFAYQPPIREVAMQAFNDIGDVYGIWGLKFDERASKYHRGLRYLTIKRSDITFMLRNSGTRLHDQIAGERHFGGNGAPNTSHDHSRN